MFNQQNSQKPDENVFRIIAAMFLPYWPLFIGLLVISFIVAKVYIKSQSPLYEAMATLIIKDENKGVDDAKLMESINPFESKKIVENEIEVIQSRTIMGAVVNDLHLYAPVFEEKRFGDLDAYLTTPVVIELKNPENIPFDFPDGPPKYNFSFDERTQEVTVEDNKYPINEWITGPGAMEVRFKLNSNKQGWPSNGLYYTLVHPRRVARACLGGLSVSPVSKHSTVISLVYWDPLPRRAEDILNHLIAAYNQKAIDDKGVLAANTLTFIEDRMSDVEKELDGLEREIQRFKSSEGAVDLSEQGKIYLKDVGDYDRQISESSRQLAVLNRIERYLNSGNSRGGLVPSSLGLNDPVLSGLLSRLYDAEIEYESLKKTTAENNPLLTSIANEIEKIRPSILQNIRNQKSNLQASLGNLSFNADQSNLALNTIPEKERALLEISRRKQIKNDLFSFLQQKREETALSYAPNQGDGRVVDFAEASPSPVSPNPQVAYFVAFALAFTIGIGYIIFKEMLNSKVLFRSEIEDYTSFPITAELPYVVNGPKESSLMKIATVVTEPIINLARKSKRLNKLLDDEMAKDLETYSHQVVLLNQFRQLGANLGLYSRHFTKKRILVTSSIAGEGKSFVSTNLAYSLALAGKKVVLLDMDFIRPFTTKRFDLSQSVGLLDLLNGRAGYADVVNKVKSHSTLSVIPVGNLNGDHTKVLLNGKLDFLFDDLSKEFDYIIIDSAPVNLVADVKLLAQYSDQTLFLIRHGVTPKQIVKHLEDSTMLKSLKEVSIVFNGIKKRGMLREDFGYGYGYSTLPEEDPLYMQKV